PGLQNREQALSIINSTGLLEFVDAASITDTATLAALAGADSSDGLKLKEGTYKSFMTGAVVKSASVAQDPTTGKIEVNVTMNADGARTWGDYTTANVGKQIAIVLDGVVKSAPVVNEPILGGQTAISGTFTPDEAKALATVLQTGALPVKLVPQDTRTVGPTLGQESLQQGLIAVLGGLIIVAIYLIAFYRGLGVVSVTAMIVFGSILLGILAVLSQFGLFALTLPGIAGVVLTIGVAADSSILINERFQEEIRLGKTFRSAAQSGTRHAIGTSIDADLVTFVSAVVLFVVAIGPVKGFALTLMLGIACDILMMMLYKRPMIMLLAESAIPKAPALWGVPKESIAIGSPAPKKGGVTRFNIDFMGNRRIMFAISTILLVISIGSLAIRGLQFGVEFQGGTVITVADAKGVGETEISEAFISAGAGNPAVQSSVNDGVAGYIVRTDVTDPAVADAEVEKVALETGLQAEEFQVTTIGPGWGRNVTNSALVAFGLSLLAIILYVSLRFEYKMSITALASVFHDLLITLGIYSLSGLEITPNTVAALLTVVGYSLYDTIVVFHRINENSQGLAKQSFMAMANDSINEVLIRSLNTTVTGLLPVVVMLIFGGPTLRDFSLALTIGLLVGAYSSIGVSAPLYAIWKEREPRYAALAKKYAHAS
ncbi:MAG: protein translocase subunit SecD, partial [Actinobacteria bacterium]|nr:protein translocase subunit SecD [Actinomycetota bacterium]